MKAEILIYIGAALPAFLGIAHLFPTRSIIRDFGDISPDNRNTIAMEWIIEGTALIFTGSLVAMITTMESRSITSTSVYLASSALLIVLAGVSLFTGFRINLLPFRLCPIIFISSALLITLGWAFL
jgi:hypothetical protein